MKRIFLYLVTFIVIPSIYAQNIDEENKNITGFNRIQTGDGDWLDVQLVGDGSSFRIRDNTTQSYWVWWTAGTSYTEFKKSIYISSGSLGIGTSTTGTHKLAVEGTIGAREIKVEADNWSDFVFNQKYRLKNLDEVEKFIENNNRLPDIPSGKDVLNNGFYLGKMDARLLQKIEELTLYMIDLNKRVEILEKENKILKKENSKLKR